MVHAVFLRKILVEEVEPAPPAANDVRSEEHTSELQSRQYLVCRLLLEKKKNLVHSHIQLLHFLLLFLFLILSARYLDVDYYPSFLLIFPIVSTSLLAPFALLCRSLLPS